MLVCPTCGSKMVVKVSEAHCTFCINKVSLVRRVKIRKSPEKIKNFSVQGVNHSLDALRFTMQRWAGTCNEKINNGVWEMKEENQRISIACENAFNPNELADMVTREKPFMYTKGSKSSTKKIYPAIRELGHLSNEENKKRRKRIESDRLKARQAENEKRKNEEKDNHKYHNDCVYVFIHQSLVHKSKKEFTITHIEGLKQASCGNYWVELDDVTEVKEIREFFKKVKNKKWSLKNKKMDIICTFDEL